jgi:hypothetical protein
VLAACDFDMRFTYFLPGYPGSCADARVWREARAQSFKLRGGALLASAAFELTPPQAKDTWQTLATARRMPCWFRTGALGTTCRNGPQPTGGPLHCASVEAD